MHGLSEGWILDQIIFSMLFGLLYERLLSREPSAEWHVFQFAQI
jgi:hypothetical protein